MPCATTESVTCYKEAVWADKWLDQPSVKRELGVDPNLRYKGINFEVNTAFMLEGDMGASSAIVLPELLNAGIRLLNYAGKAGKLVTFVYPGLSCPRRSQTPCATMLVISSGSTRWRATRS